MNRSFFGVALFAILFSSVYALTCCKSQGGSTKEETSPIVNVVGEIFSDSTIDRPNFKTCNPQEEIVQYYAFNKKTYEGEKFAIQKAFDNQFKIDTNIKDSGWLRIRFIINCNGQSGRFRETGMDLNYRKRVFHPFIVDQLMTITKGLNNWKPMTARGIKRDYYQYLLFKIENGKLIEILP